MFKREGWGNFLEVGMKGEKGECLLLNHKVARTCVDYSNTTEVLHYWVTSRSNPEEFHSAVEYQVLLSF